MEKIKLQQAVWEYYHAFGRHDLPWRVPEPDGQFDPYKIVVSEIMLQQTQVSRVIPKFNDLIAQFPSVRALAAAPLSEVLRAWSGLGYNRRAKYLHQAAQVVANDLQGVFPSSVADLTKLPGVGKNTAGAVIAYSYNQPVLFIETNIRSVYIHHLFADQQAVSDHAILAAVEDTLPAKGEYREWYWALMDYGSHLKRHNKLLNTLSKTYTKQVKFEGSKRQVRGQVIKHLAQQPLALAALLELVADERLLDVLADLLAEGLIQQHGDRYSL